MRTICGAIIVALIGFPASACDWSAGVGATVRYAEGQTGQLVTVGCAWQKYELRLHWFDTQHAYDRQLKVESYAALSAQRVVTFNRDGLLRPFLSVGALLKERDRCRDGEGPDLTCNRLLHEPLNFVASVGVMVGRWRVSVSHASNLSYSSPNTGQDFVEVSLRF